MGVNRFMGPVKDQFQQTYVDQYVPMPFELMQRRAEREQKKFDTVQSNWDTLNAKMGERLLDVDNPLMNAKMTEVQDSVNSALENAGGDWRQLNRTVVNAAADYNKSIKSGVLASALTQKEKYASEVKLIDDAVKKGGMAGHVGEKMKDRLYRDYKKEGGVDKGAEIGGAILYDASGLQSELQDWVSKLKPDKDSNPIVTYGDDGNLLITGWDDKTELGKKRIQKLSTAMFGNQNFKAMIDAEYYALEPSESKTDYANRRFAQMFNGFDANAYVQEESRRTAKETEAAKAARKTKEKFTPVTPRVSKDMNFKYDIDADFRDENGEMKDDPLDIINAKNSKAGTTLVNSTLKDQFLKDNQGYKTNAEKDKAFNDWFKTWADKVNLPYEVNEKSGMLDENSYNTFLKEVATNKDISFTNDLFGGNVARQKQFKQKAVQEWKAVEQRNELVAEAHQELVARGIEKGYTDDKDPIKQYEAERKTFCRCN